MTVQDLLDQLLQVKDKTVPVSSVVTYGERESQKTSTTYCEFVDMGSYVCIGGEEDDEEEFDDEDDEEE